VLHLNCQAHIALPGFKEVLSFIGQAGSAKLIQLNCEGPLWIVLNCLGVVRRGFECADLFLYCNCIYCYIAIVSIVILQLCI